MPGIRCFYSHSPAPDDELPGKFIRLDVSESRHLLKARRTRIGDDVTAFDGEGNLWECRLEEADESGAGLTVLSRQRVPPPRCQIILAQALPKSNVMDRILQKATELGVWSVQPLITAHCEAKITPSAYKSKISRWRKIAIESCKQSGNPFLPRILAPMSLQDYSSGLSPGSGSLKLLASLDQNHIKQSNPLNLGDYPPTEAVWLIGPEGDLSEEEYALAYRHGFQPVSLGPNVLRVETAATVALGILNYSLATHDTRRESPSDPK